MAARNPSTWNYFNDLNDLVPRHTIDYVVPTAVIDDQQYVLDCPRLIVSDCFAPIASTADTWEIIRRYYVANRDMCGTITPAQENVYMAILAWASGANNFAVGVYDSINSVWAGIEVTADQTDKIWRGWYGNLTLYTDDTENEIKLGVERTEAAGTIYVAGIMLFSGDLGA